MPEYRGPTAFAPDGPYSKPTALSCARSGPSTASGPPSSASSNSPLRTIDGVLQSGHERHPVVPKRRDLRQPARTRKPAHLCQVSRQVAPHPARVIYQEPRCPRIEERHRTPLLKKTWDGPQWPVHTLHKILEHMSLSCQAQLPTVRRPPLALFGALHGLCRAAGARRSACSFAGSRGNGSLDSHAAHYLHEIATTVWVQVHDEPQRQRSSLEGNLRETCWFSRESASPTMVAVP